MRGNIEQGDLASVIREVYSNRMSGILHLRRGQVTKRIYFKKGSMIFANSDVNDDRLGEFLIRNGRIERKVFDLASKVVQETRERLGKTIVEMGHMTGDEMEGWVIWQIEAIIYSLFQWDSFDYNFEQHENPVDEDIILTLSTADIVLEGVRQMPDTDRIARALGNPDLCLRHSENPLLLYQTISLSPAEGFVLSRVDGTSTLSDIMSTSPLTEAETQRCVYGLVSAGVLDLQSTGAPSAAQGERPGRAGIPMPEAALRRGAEKAEKEDEAPTPEMVAIRNDITAKHASLATATHYDLLGIDDSASYTDIKTAYYSMVKKYHPDKHHSPYLEDVSGLLEELFTKISKAYHTLSSPDERYVYDVSLKSPGPRGDTPAPRSGSLHRFVDPASPEHTAAKLYVEGRRLYDNMSYFDAIQHLQEAVRLDPSKSPYHKLLAQSLMKNPHWQKEAEEHFLKALEIDELDTECHLALGEIYSAAGLENRAKNLYSHVLELDPDNQEASLRLQGKARSRGRG